MMTTADLVFLPGVIGVLVEYGLLCTFDFDQS